jgi:hypothetical protein
MLEENLMLISEEDGHEDMPFQQAGVSPYYHSAVCAGMLDHTRKRYTILRTALITHTQHKM